MTLRLSVLVCTVSLLVFSGCGNTAPSSTFPTPPQESISATGGATPSIEDAEEQKLAAFDAKYSAVHGSGTVLALQTVPGTYISFRANSAPNNARLADIARDLKDVKQPILLDLQECKELSAAALAPLVELKCLSGIYLKGTGLKGLVPTVAKATHLHYLLLVDDTLTDADLAPIAALVNLRGLVVFGDQKMITGATYKYLADMTELGLLASSISSSALTFTDADLAHVSKLAKLKEFTVRSGPGEKLSDRGLANLKGMTGLEKLQVELTSEVTADSLAVIGGLKQLNDLQLWDKSAKLRSGIDKLLPLAGRLKVFKFNCWSFDNAPPASTDAAWIGIVAKFTGLEELSLVKLNLDDKSLSLLSGLTGLRQLELIGNPIIGSGLTHLKTLAKLEDLDLQYTALTDASAAAIKGLPPSVTTINVRGTKITKPVLDELENSRKWQNFFR